MIHDFNLKLVANNHADFHDEITGDDSAGRSLVAAGRRHFIAERTQIKNETN
jgi:hypothetical protein